MFTTLLLALQANLPPFQPLVTEPPVLGPALSPGDIHMVASFADPDPGDVHTATDWELWRVAPLERVWSALGAVGPGLTHVQLGNGVFEGSHAGLWSLFENTPYLLRVRHRDDSGDPTSEWSPFAQRAFATGAAEDWFALELGDVLSAPAPRWTLAADGAPVDLAGGAVPPQLILETGFGAPLLTVTGAGGPDVVAHGPPLAGLDPVRLRLRGGSDGLVLPPSDLELYAPGCDRHEVLLPSLDVGAFQTAVLWISSDGITFDGEPSQTAPAFETPARLPEPPWLPEQPGFAVETFATGFALPVDVAFVPHPGPGPDDVVCYVSELYGEIKSVTRDGTVSSYATNLLNYTPPLIFPGSGEQGLTGLAVDPASGDVFAALLYDTGQGTPWNPVAYPKVVRLASLDGGHTAASVATVLDFVGEVQGQSHQISNLHVADDGRLFVHMGDGFDPLTAQDLSSFRGKILRAELDGSPATDNPYYDPSDGFDARDWVWASGVRNPFGGDVRASDGHLYVVENGPWQDRFARITPGLDLGWKGSGSQMAIHALWNWFPARAPVDLAFAQSATFGGGGFPDAKLDHAFVTLSGPTYAAGPQAGAKRIEEFALAADGSPVGAPVPLVTYVGDGQSSAAGLAFGPDGLYFSTLYPDPLASGPSDAGASLLRVSWVGDLDCNGDGVPDGCQTAQVVVRAGEPPNPLALAAPPPVLGTIWQPALDHSTFEPGAAVDVLVIAAGAANAPAPFGTILCDLGGALLWFDGPAGGVFQIAVPSDCALLGATLCAQGLSVGPFGGLALTNALDLTLGT